MRKNIILITPFSSYGDTFSVIGLFYFLSNYYEKVYLYLFNNPSLHTYYLCYFSNEPLFNKKFFICENPEDLIKNGNFGEYDICDTFTPGWVESQQFYEIENIDKDFYFSHKNPIYNKLELKNEFIFKPNKHVPNTELSVNHRFYYESIGLSNVVRMDFFDYKRNLTRELEIKENILKEKGIIGEYNIINDPGHCRGGIVWENIIKNELPIINISYLSTCVGELMSLVESAKEIHFIESNNVNFFYHSQYKKIFNYEKNIFFHIHLRNRHWKIENMMLDDAWKMMDDPKLENWDFIF